METKEEQKKNGTKERRGNSVDTQLSSAFFFCFLLYFFGHVSRETKAVAPEIYDKSRRTTEAIVSKLYLYSFWEYRLLFTISFADEFSLPTTFGVKNLLLLLLQTWFG